MPMARLMILEYMIEFYQIQKFHQFKVILLRMNVKALLLKVQLVHHVEVIEFYLLVLACVPPVNGIMVPLKIVSLVIIDVLPVILVPSV